MNYYKFHLGDYLSHTAHLDPLEDLAYRRLLDFYYHTESPIPNETQTVSKRLRLGSHVAEVVSVLKEFFRLDESTNCWHHKRCDEEIAAYKGKAAHNKQIGLLGGRPKKTQTEPRRNPDETQTVSKNNPNHKPITINHKPITNKKIKASATVLPPDFCISDRVKNWATQKGYESLEAHFENFVGVSRAKGYVYVDWDEAFMTAVRNDWANLRGKAQGNIESLAERLERRDVKTA